MEEILSIKSLGDNVREVPPSYAESGPLLRRYQVAMELKRVRLLPVLELLLPTATICT